MIKSLLPSLKIAALMPVFLLMAPASYSQSGFLHDVYLSYDPNAQRSYAGNAYFDEGAGDWVIENAWSDSDIHAFGDHTIDPINNRFYQVYGDSLNMYLLMFDLITGDSLKHLYKVDSVGNGAPGSVTIGGNINGTFYNCMDNCVYFTHYKAPFEDSIHLAKVNVNDYTVTELASFPISYYSIDNMVFPAAQNVYFLYYDYFAQTSKVFTYSIPNNTLTSVNVSVPNFNIGECQLTYNYSDGMLYGVHYDLDSFNYNNYLGTITGVRLNPVTGVLDFITPGYYANLIGVNTSLHSTSSGDKVYFTTQSTNPSYFLSLATFDVSNAVITFDTVTFANAPFGNPTPWGLDIYETTKGCPVATGTGSPPVNDCSIKVAAAYDEQTLIIQTPCAGTLDHDYQLQVYDILGRPVLASSLHEPQQQFIIPQMQSSALLYRITDGKLKLKSGIF